MRSRCRAFRGSPEWILDSSRTVEHLLKGLSPTAIGSVQFPIEGEKVPGYGKPVIAVHHHRSAGSNPSQDPGDIRGESFRATKIILWIAPPVGHALPIGEGPADGTLRDSAHPVIMVGELVDDHPGLSIVGDRDCADKLAHLGVVTGIVAHGVIAGDNLHGGGDEARRSDHLSGEPNPDGEQDG